MRDKLNFKRVLNFRERDWKLMADYIDVMAPLAKSLTMVQSTEYGGLGFVMPVLFVIKHSIHATAPKTPEGNAMKVALLEALEEKCGSLLEININNRHLLLASVSCPRYRLKWLPSGQTQGICAKFIGN